MQVTGHLYEKEHVADLMVSSSFVPRHNIWAGVEYTSLRTYASEINALY